MSDYNQQQQIFIESELINSRLLGNPGCGKTKSIIGYCLDKHAKKIINTSKHFIIVTFSKSAQQDFVRKGKLSNKPTIFNQMNIKTVHSLAATIFKRLHSTSTTSINTIVLATYKSILNISSDKLLDVPCLNQCKFIIVDEAQDINANQYNLINLICNRLNIPCILVGDPNQNIYQFQGGSDKYLMEHDGDEYNLMNNYRSSNQIIEFINHVRPYSKSNKMIAGSAFDGPKPIIINDKIDRLRQYIVKAICESGLNYQDIAIIGSVKQSKANYKSFGLNLVCQTLAENDIEFIAHYADGLGARSGKNQTRVPNHVNVMTCHGSKGLEFKMVIIVNFHLNTFSCVPTEESYNQHRYLWYVALSRAINKLVICVDHTKQVHPIIHMVPSHTYKLIGIELIERAITFKKNVTPVAFATTEVIGDNNYFNEEAHLNFESMQIFNSSIDTIYQLESPIDLIDNYTYGMLYGLYMERIFMLYYYKHKNDIGSLVSFMKQSMAKIVYVSSKAHKNAYWELRNKNIIDSHGCCHIMTIAMHTLSDSCRIFLSYCVDVTQAKDYVVILLENAAIDFNPEYFNGLCDQLLAPNIDQESILFDIVLYLYQISNEKKYWLSYDFSEHKNQLSGYFVHIDELASSYNNLIFEVAYTHPNININSRIDVIDNDTTSIIELKFTNEITLHHEEQLAIYYNNVYPDWTNDNEMYIINLKTGKQKILTINHKSSNWQFNMFICDTLRTQMSNNIFILDLETNAIDPDIHFSLTDNNEIIDRYVYEYKLKCAVSEGLIKNQCPLNTSHITGIYESDLVDANQTIDQFKLEMDCIFKYCNNPIFIAHNGKGFDFPIMRHYKLLSGSCEYKLKDSIPIIRLLTEANAKSNKLIDQYNYVFDCDHQQAHRAKEDVDLISDIFNYYELSIDDLCGCD